MLSTVRGQIDLTFQSRARSKVTSLIDRLKCTCDITRDPQVTTDSCISVTTVMGVSQLYRAYVTTCGHVDSVELWSVKVVKSTGSYWGDLDDACVVWGHSHSPVDIDSHKLNSWKVVQQCVLTCSHRERPFSCSVSDYQCRRDCDLKRHMRRHKSPQ